MPHLRWNNFVHCWKAVVSTLYYVDSTLFQRGTPTIYRRGTKLEIQYQILFYFQRLINVISKLIHNVETTLIRRLMFAGLGK